MWDNDDWAKAHLEKRHPDVSTQEAWDVVFEEDSEALVSPDQYRYPPFRRYWTIGQAKTGKRLLVAWEQWRGIKNLVTAYPPSEDQVRVYEEKIKRTVKKAK
jgi:hypothetical protein